MLGESHAREISRVLESSLSGVQKALRSLELDGMVAARAVGRARLYRINPRAHARRELERYLERLAEAERDLSQHVARLRRRPRRSGKPL
jgi:sugar-specific transcriptional regulator TrmB